ncbi:copper-binding protein [Variovorax sp. NFACC27]|jgi:Cu/Ag efflux protein CusF|uniref:copper-binding protein n=1 Tax=unclassified Variovorax TaxID=663243 RepID=UPI000894E2FD|nr:Copper binding protein CusF [Variovorax sp. NFACC28]SEG98979.1 Copper binding protein CusF [Variovorax sp. NFACC29]SFE16721.1 Copper binding protein CusF [Variovorax sp. NFACC26]SFH06734.1 Copper binding protein CusF [Variovorax sp. NFACC27]SEF35231.1 Copper binding protein CusF [Variovorax sp. NFACC28]
MTHEATSMISRRHQLVFLCAYIAPGFGGRIHAQSSANDFIAGEIVKIDAERGEVTLRHEPIAHLHLPARTTIFRYVDARVILRAKAGDKVRFRADRFEGTLRVTAILVPGTGVPGAAQSSPTFRK